MTLIEKFDKATDGWIVSHACEEIADDYAVEFAEWVERLRDSDIDSLDYAFWLDNTTKELLAIFKKEKGYESIV